ncbi:hypothetical protein [Actinoplanes sp. NPDC026670]|uniref:hypothetical protein n=1 Tax=Actinoplanes sp. NPDC026670 TaxID=3154700 RepID=UPI0033E98540
MKELVDWAGKRGMSTERLGFSNARMAYDDLIARFLLTLEQGRLTEKITALRITARYRAKEPFDEAIIETAKKSLDHILNLSVINRTEQRLKWNKATVHTWLCMTAKLIREDAFHDLSPSLEATIETIERLRGARRSGHSGVPLEVFNDRATARVADVSSVVLRDFTAWMILVREYYPEAPINSFLSPIPKAWSLLQEIGDSAPEPALSSFSLTSHWGGDGWF